MSIIYIKEWPQGTTPAAFPEKIRHLPVIFVSLTEHACAVLNYISIAIRFGIYDA